MHWDVWIGKIKKKKSEFFHQWNGDTDQKTAGVEERSGRWSFHFSFAKEKPQLFSGLLSDVLPIPSDSLKRRKETLTAVPSTETTKLYSLSHGIKPKEDTEKIKHNSHVSVFKRNRGQGMWEHHGLYDTFLVSKNMRVTGFPWMH